MSGPKKGGAYTMELSIIIINYNTFKLTCDCIRSVKKFTKLITYEIILVDNASSECIPDLFLTEYPDIVLIKSKINAGFARANNATIRVAKGEVILLLNPDTLVEENAIATCCNRLLQSEYVAAGVQLLNPDKSPQITGSYFMKGGLNHLMALPYCGRLIRQLGYILKVKKTNIPKAEGVVEVDWINGAFLMVKRYAIEKAGMLDEDFFLYSEEIEWCSRLRKTGKMCVYGDLHTIHLQGESTSDAFGSIGKGYSNLSDRKGLQIMLSGLVRVRKQFGIGWFLFHLMAHLFTIPVYFIIALLRSIFFLPGRKVEWKTWWGFSKNVVTICSYLFRILRNKPYFYKIL